MWDVRHFSVVQFVEVDMLGIPIRNIAIETQFLHIMRIFDYNDRDIASQYITMTIACRRRLL